MSQLDLGAIHALALQKSGAHSARDISKLVVSLDYEGIATFSELRSRLAEENLSGFFPDEKSWNEAMLIIDKNDSLGIKSLAINSAEYPKYLRNIDNPPAVLHVRGNLDCFNRLPGVAVVGTRKVTPNGEKIAYRISAFLAEKGWAVVSGLALGVDASAHKGALSVAGQGNTIAVLAHGLERAKPVANSSIGEEILERGGVWVSEHPVNTPAKPAYFVERNRIQLGLSVGSIIVEAEPKSGSITQAKFCIKQRRPLFAVIPEDQSNRLNLLSKGTELLVNEMGAYPLKTKEDYPKVLERFAQQRALMLSV